MLSKISNEAKKNLETIPNLQNGYPKENLYIVFIKTHNRIPEEMTKGFAEDIFILITNEIL